MGMYTNFSFATELVKETPEEVLVTLEYLTGAKGPITNTPPWDIWPLPDHEFFRCERWDRIGCGSSAYFVGGGVSRLTRSQADYKDHEVVIRCSLKNYGNEINLFLNWIKPWVYPRGFLGTVQYEEEIHPTLLYCFIRNYIEVIDIALHMDTQTKGFGRL